MPAGTSVDAIYAGIEAVILGATGRACWKKTAIQAQPQGPYATLYLTQGMGVQLPVTENVALETPGPNGELFKQVPWGTQLVKCQVEFLRSSSINSAIQAANQFANSLRLEARYYDLWQLCGLVDAVSIIDISAIFRADIEPRARAEFSVYANIADISDQSLENNDVFNIETQPVTIQPQEVGTNAGASFTVNLPIE